MLISVWNHHLMTKLKNSFYESDQDTTIFKNSFKIIAYLLLI